MTTEEGVYESALRLFSIGVGPSSSHTVGPMRAALSFRQRLLGEDLLDGVEAIVCRLYGSLAATGLGHGTPDAVIAGLRGFEPSSVPQAELHGKWQSLQNGQAIRVGTAALTERSIVFEPKNRDFGHPNALSFTARTPRGDISETYLSTGGGFIRKVGEATGRDDRKGILSEYRSMSQLMRELAGRSIADVAWADEVAMHGADLAEAGLQQIRQTMLSSLHRGLHTEGTLPGFLRVPRRVGLPCNP